MNLPDALVVGPRKAGTTWIYNYLAARGDVCLPSVTKELFFFDRLYGRGTAWYVRQFQHHDAATHRRVVEVAPSLFSNDAVPARVRATLGSPRIVFTIRDPIRRAWSHYLHLRRYGYSNAPLVETAERFPELVEESRYAVWMARWRDALPGASFTVVSVETLKEDQARYVAALCSGLGLPYVDPTRFGLVPANEAARAPSFQLAKLARRSSYALRDAGLYSVVTLAKRLGLKRVLYGAPRTTAATLSPTPEDIDWIRHQLDLSDRPRQHCA